MEDLWIVQNSGVDLDDFADLAEYKRFIKRFCQEEERAHQKRLLYLESHDTDCKNSDDTKKS